ncbi:hypothetical protein [Spiroplasma chinense]|uniref:hypothetical protein n=1 Tax=Spiroplasma chinense TaxID=216932 RepID=UPI0014133EC6|nr:hypothetical protein [Spiroplasma chinense]
MINENPSFFINCADQPKEKILELTSRCSRETKIPYITAAVGIESGWWGPIIDKYNNKNYSFPKSKTESNNLKIEGSSSTTNLIIGAVLSNDVMNYFLRKNNNLYIGKEISFLNYEIKRR